MNLVLENSKSKVLIIMLLLLTSLFSAFSSASAYTSIDTKEDTTAKVLDGKKKDYFLNLAEQSKVFKTIAGTTKFAENSLVQEASSADNDLYSKLVIISAVEEGNDLNQYQVFIDPVTNEVVRTIVINLTGEKSDDAFSYSDYDEEGTLRVEAEGTVEDIQTGDIDFIEKPGNSDEITTQAVPDKYIYWACRFSGFVACQTATLACGPAKFLCNLACSYAFKKAACDRYK